MHGRLFQDSQDSVREFRTDCYIIVILYFFGCAFRKPPKPPKKTQFASSFDELKQVHRGTRANSSRNGTSEGRHGAQ